MLWWMTLLAGAAPLCGRSLIATPSGAVCHHEGQLIGLDTTSSPTWTLEDASVVEVVGVTGSIVVVLSEDGPRGVEHDTGRVAWHLPTEQRPHPVRLLPDGHALVFLGGDDYRLVDRAGTLRSKVPTSTPDEATFVVDTARSLHLSRSDDGWRWELLRLDGPGSWGRGFTTPGERMPSVSAHPWGDEVFVVVPGAVWRLGTSLEHIEVPDVGAKPSFIADETLYLPTHTGRMTALARDGTTRWTHETLGHVVPTAQGLVSYDGHQVWLHDDASGAVRAAWTLPSHVTGVIVDATGRMLAGTKRGMQALDIDGLDPHLAGARVGGARSDVWQGTVEVHPFDPAGVSLPRDLQPCPDGGLLWKTGSNRRAAFFRLHPDGRLVTLRPGRVLDGPIQCLADGSVLFDPVTLEGQRKTVVRWDGLTASLRAWFFDAPATPSIRAGGARWSPVQGTRDGWVVHSPTSHWAAEVSREGRLLREVYLPYATGLHRTPWSDPRPRLTDDSVRPSQPLQWSGDALEPHPVPWGAVPVAPDTWVIQARPTPGEHVLIWMSGDGAERHRVVLPEDVDHGQLYRASATHADVLLVGHRWLGHITPQGVVRGRDAAYVDVQGCGTWNGKLLVAASLWDDPNEPRPLELWVAPFGPDSAGR